MAVLRPRWSTDPTDDDLVALPPEDYQLLLADHAQQIAGAWAGALRRGDTAAAALYVARLRALSAAGITSTSEALDADARAIRTPRLGGVRLFMGSDPSLWQGLRATGEGARQVDIVVAYAQPGGVRLLTRWLQAVASAGGGPCVRLLVGTYLNGTSTEALRLLLELAETSPGVSVRLLADPTVHFHPKVYRVVDAQGRCHLFVGSSNLSLSALTGRSSVAPAVEWNLGLDEDAAPAVVEAATARLDHLLATQGVALSEAAIAAYEAQRSRALPPAALLEDVAPPPEQFDPRPAQTEALAALAQLRAQGYRRALVVAATGLGKTVLAALDSVAAAPSGRVLFLAHREALLTQARDAFAQLRPDESCGLVHADARELDARHLFVSIASARHVDPSAFDYVVIDEAHHGAAKSYRRIFDQLGRAAFVLGLTATPDRLDGGDIFELFDDVVAYEVNLVEAIGRGWLVPFHYFGLRDTLELGQRALREMVPSELESAVLAQGRMEHVVRALLDPKYPGTRTLAFCVSIRHAQQVAARLMDAGVPAAAVHSGPSSADPATAILRLRSGALSTLCVVDMFNEGIDIPEVDRVAFLRPTDSPVVFLQQLGRGLRVVPPKTALVVVDFVANHRRAELRPEWLGVAPGDVVRSPAGTAYQHRFADGRTVFFEPAAVDALRALGQRRFSLRDRLRDTFDRLRAEAPEAARPSYRQFLAHAGVAHGTVRSLFGSWLGLIEEQRACTVLDAALARDADAHGLLEAIERTDMSGPHKMLLLGAMSEARRPSCSLDEAARLVRGFIDRRHPAVLLSPTIAQDKLQSIAALQDLLRRMPVKYLLESAPRWFRLDHASSRFEIVMPSATPITDILEAVEERAEARLFDFLRQRPADATEAIGKIVRNKSGTLFLNVERYRTRLPAIPEGAEGVWVELRYGAERWWGWLVKIAINRICAAPTDDQANIATDVLRTVVDAETSEHAGGRHLRLRPITDEPRAFALASV